MAAEWKSRILAHQLAVGDRQLIAVGGVGHNAAGEQFVENDAHGEDVAPWSASLHEVLGRHIRQAARNGLALRFAGFALRDAEVDELYDDRLLRAFDHHQVVRLDVAMDDVVFVGVLEPFRSLDDDVEFLNKVQLAAGLDDRAQRLALQVLHRQVRTRVVDPKLVHRNDVRVLQFGEGRGFLLEGVDRGGVVAKAGQDFDGDVSAQRVAGLVNSAVPTLAELFLKLKLADLGQKLR